MTAREIISGSAPLLSIQTALKECHPSFQVRLSERIFEEAHKRETLAEIKNDLKEMEIGK